MTLRANPYVLQPHEGAVLDVGYTRLRLDEPNPGLLMTRSGGVVQASHHAGFLVIGVVAVHHPDAGMVRDQGDADFLRRQHDGGVLRGPGPPAATSGLAFDSMAHDEQVRSIATPCLLARIGWVTTH
jgi:hypothetical protein